MIDYEKIYEEAFVHTEDHAASILAVARAVYEDCAKVCGNVAKDATKFSRARAAVDCEELIRARMESSHD